MADSWEDIDEQPHAQASAERKAPAGGLNPNASSFSFNPSASTFTPSFAPKPQETTAPAQPIQESSAPSAAQSYEQQQPHHADTNGFIDHKQDAQPMHMDPPSERDTPVTSASTPAHHTDEHMQEADVSSATAGVMALHTPESNMYLCLLLDKLQHLSCSDATCRVTC